MLALAVSNVVPATAQTVSWAHQTGGFVSNGSVTVKRLSGSGAVGTRNPTGATTKTTQSVATQPPTVIVQATASLPIKAIGDGCTSSTSGGYPNQTAGEGTAILADRTALLTCQSGVWRPMVDSCPNGYVMTGGSCQSIASFSNAAPPADTTPSGTVCGLTFGVSPAYCQGYPVGSCPPGYQQVSLQNGSGVSLYFCQKS